MSLKSKFFSAFPVIGGHMGIEADLLLSGEKPLGWVAVIDNPPTQDELKQCPETVRAAVQKEIDDQNRLDAAVRDGRLIAKDVTVDLDDANGASLRFTSRHYAQPWNGKNLSLMADFNQKGFNGKPVDPQAEMNVGKMLGYRKRDRMLWEAVNRMPHRLRNLVIRFNEKLTLPAYQAEAVKRARKSMPAP